MHGYKLNCECKSGVMNVIVNTTVRTFAITGAVAVPDPYVSSRVAINLFIVVCMGTSAHVERNVERSVNASMTVGVITCISMSVGVCVVGIADLVVSLEDAFYVSTSIGRGKGVKGNWLSERLCMLMFGLVKVRR